MSHFTVLVIGDNPEDQLEPFNENLEVEYKDLTEQYKKEYETEEVSEFFCASSSSWGMKITKELYNQLKSAKIGANFSYRSTGRGMGYFEKGKKYKGYYELEGHKRCKGSQWFEVVEIVETSHPNEHICFEGKITVRKISKPRKIALKDKYPVYEDYLRNWHGVEDISRIGYDFNPKAKWDWYQLGGRWTGFFTLKPNTNGNVGDHSLVSERRAEVGTADQARKKDIDFDAMRDSNFEEASQIYDEFEEKTKKGELQKGDAYFRYGIEWVEDKDDPNGRLQTREEFLKKRASLSTFAVLKDGEWYEKGEMGWWAIVSNEKDPDEWNNQFDQLVAELPEDTLLSLYDCHI